MQKTSNQFLPHLTKFKIRYITARCNVKRCIENKLNNNANVDAPVDEQGSAEAEQHDDDSIGNIFENLFSIICC